MSVNKYNGTDLIKIAGKGKTGGLGGDTKDCTTTFTSSDDSTESGLIIPSGGDITVPQVTTNDTHANLFSGLSKITLNTRKIINTVKRVWNTVASSWAEGETYAVGDIRLWVDGHTYVCKLAHTSSSSITPADTTYWEDKTLGDMISQLNSNYANLNTPTQVASSTWRNITIPSGKHFQFSMMKLGKVINFKLWFDFSIDNGTLLLTIPEQYLPANLGKQYPPNFYIKSCNDPSGIIYCGQDGKIKANVALGSWCVFETTWICN